MSMASVVEAELGAGEGLFESSTMDRSGAMSSCGSTITLLCGDASHRNSMRPNLKKSRFLQKSGKKISGRSRW